jgi:ribosomal protein L29
MEINKIKKIKFIEINNVDEASKLYKDMKQAYLELRLSSRQAEIKDYKSQKNIIKKNMARALTFISFNAFGLSNGSGVEIYAK